MKKILLTGMMVLLLGACTSTQEDTARVNRDTKGYWMEGAGDIDSEYWWVDSCSDDSE